MGFNSSFKGLKTSTSCPHSAFISDMNVTGKVHPLYRHWGSVQAVRPIGRVEVKLYSFMTTALEGGEGSASRPGRSLTPEKEPVPIVQEAGWAPEPVWTGAENLAPNRDSIPKRPARSQSLYRLHYPAHHLSQRWTQYTPVSRYGTLYADAYSVITLKAGTSIWNCKTEVTNSNKERQNIPLKQ